MKGPFEPGAQVEFRGPNTVNSDWRPGVVVSVRMAFATGQFIYEVQRRSTGEVLTVNGTDVRASGEGES